MKRFEQLSLVITAIIGGFGGIAGLWGAYTAQYSVKVKHPLDEHEQVAKSFQSQIDSTEKRNDKNEALRLRKLYEKYEEEWRIGQRVAKLVAPIQTLASQSLDSKDKTELSGIISTISGKPNLQLPQKTLGAAFYALGDYEQAALHLKTASTEGDDPKVFALQAATFSELSKNAPTEAAKAKYNDLAEESFRTALSSPTAKPAKLADFAASNPYLNTILFDRGVKLTSSSTRTQQPPSESSPHAP